MGALRMANVNAGCRCKPNNGGLNPDLIVNRGHSWRSISDESRLCQIGFCRHPAQTQAGWGSFEIHRDCLTLCIGYRRVDAKHASERTD